MRRAGQADSDMSNVVGPVDDARTAARPGSRCDATTAVAAGPGRGRQHRPVRPRQPWPADPDGAVPRPRDGTPSPQPPKRRQPAPPVGNQPNTRTTLVYSSRTSTPLILPARAKPQPTASTNRFWHRIGTRPCWWTVRTWWCGPTCTSCRSHGRREGHGPMNGSTRDRQSLMLLA
jgi:hypothetical protein